MLPSRSRERRHCRRFYGDRVFKFAGRGGPLVVARTYEARLNVRGRTHSATFAALIDPRVGADGVTVSDLRAQELLNLRIRDALSESRRMARQIEQLIDTLGTRLEGGEEGTPATVETREVVSELEALRAALVTGSDVPYPETMLIDQLEYLYGMTTSADQRPGADACQRLESLEAELEGQRAELERVIEERLGESRG